VSRRKGQHDDTFPSCIPRYRLDSAVEVRYPLLNVNPRLTLPLLVTRVTVPGSPKFARRIQGIDANMVTDSEIVELIESALWLSWGMQ